MQLAAKWGMVELTSEELMQVDGGVNWLAVGGGIASIALSVVAVGVSAAIGFGVGGPAGAVAAAGACAKATAPLWVGGIGAIALGCL